MTSMGYTRLLSLAISSLVAVSSTHAEIILHGTRVIYPADSREVTLQLSNNGAKPSLVQAWIDEGNPKITPDQSHVPFMINPPISRVDPKKSQSLRISALPSASTLSQTQESVFWLNILDIPPRPKATGNKEEQTPDNFLQLAIRSRIKFFYRPAHLKQDVATAPEKLQWQQQGQSLNIHNPTPYFITITSIYQQQNHKKVDLLHEGLMVRPFADEKIDLKQSNFANLSFVNVNDYGGRKEREIKLN